MNETDASAILAPLWRRKWLILAVAIIVGAGSYLYYRGKTKVFESSTQIYLGGASEEAAFEKTTGRGNPSQTAANQVAVINSIIVAQVRRQLRHSEAPVDRAAARGTVKAKAAEKSEFITITAEDHTAKSTALLANSVALAYLKREHASRRRAINTEIEIARRQLRRLELTSVSTPTSKSGSGSKSSPSSSTASVLQEATLTSRINQLEDSLGVVGAQQVSQAQPRGAVQTAPKPRQNAIFGFALGLLLACVFAYMLDRFDRRVRTITRAESLLGGPILTALPTVRRPLVIRESGPSPSRLLLEPLRRLHAALRFRPAALSINGAPDPALAGAARAPKVILVTSADVGDGKSTLVADLALVQREAGERVAVVDANMRRPALSRLLGVEPNFGLAQVLTGGASVEEAMQTVRVGAAERPPASRQPNGGVATAVGSPTLGSLSVLASGGASANPPALLAGGSMSDLLTMLGDEYDSVLIDGPSPLEVSDVLPLLRLVDGVVVIVRVAHTREPSAQRLMQILRDEARAPMLGVVVNCATPKQIERQGLSSPNGSGWARFLSRR